MAPQVYNHNGTIEYHASFLERPHKYYKSLQENLKWSQPQIKIFGKEIPIPRKQSFYGDSEISYKYSGTTFHANPWHPVLLDIKKEIEIISNAKFNCVLCNLYRDGKDYMSLHSDNEPELGKNPVIASISLGEERVFHIQSKDKLIKKEFRLRDGDLLIMKGAFQENWNHGIKKTARPKDARINLTFRYIYK